MSNLILYTACVYFLVKLFEITTPARPQEIKYTWFVWLVGVNICSMGLAWAFSHLFNHELPQDYWRDLIWFYLVYSLCNYWVHRIKHHPRFWFIHEMHHAPDFMRTEITVWRHPVETMINLLILSGLCYLLSVPYIVAASALVVEGTLELYHHSNTRTPKSLRWLRFIVQVPEMHLVHHQKGLHHYNYSPLALWDWIFSTAKVPHAWQFKHKLGLHVFHHPRRLFFWL